MLSFASCLSHSTMVSVCSASVRLLCMIFFLFLFSHCRYVIRVGEKETFCFFSLTTRRRRLLFFLEIVIMVIPFSNTKLRVPKGFQSLLVGLSTEVLRSQPRNIHQFAAEYFEKLLQRRGKIFSSRFSARNSFSNTDQ